MTPIRSRDNARVKRWARLVQDGKFRKSEKRVLLEGPHLVAAALESGLNFVALIATEEGLAKREIAALAAKAGGAPILLDKRVFDAVVEVDTPQGVAAEIEIPNLKGERQGALLFLEAIQDAGNLGTIVRSAAAFGAAGVVVDRACADPWSPKVLRAGMGGHFTVPIRQAASLESELERFGGRVLCTVAQGGSSLREVDLSGRIGWLFGSEGRGVSALLQGRAAARVTIPGAAGAESLNVAAAAAICLYETFSRPGAGS